MRPEGHGRSGDPRAAAARVVERVLAGGAHLSVALDHELGRRAWLDPRDRALCTQLAYGTIRCRAALQRRLEPFQRRPHRDPLVQGALLVGAYQLLALDRIPAHAAVDAAVERARRGRGAAPAGFVNAVLRRVAKLPKVPEAELALEGAPAWLLRRLERDVGQDAPSLLGVGLPPPGVVVRWRGGEPAPGRPGRRSVRARTLDLPGDPRGWPGYGQGDFVVQEEGSQFVALALGARGSERVLDACAGHGGKALAVAERLGPPGELVAADLHPRKLEQLVREAARLGVRGIRTHAVDWTVGTGRLAPEFDRILVDAPCSGVGTLRRRPEILGRLSESDLARLAATQREILRRVATLLRPGGTLVYSVCSVLREEAEEVVEGVRDLLAPTPFDAPEVVAAFGDVEAFRLTPASDGTDGFYCARLVRRS